MRIGILVALLLATPALAQEEEKPFLSVAKVLQSPRCVNCHPAGDAPLQHDAGKPHAQMITRDLESVGMACSSCHQETQMEGPHMPPGAPNWHLPPAATPMVFQGKTPRELCLQLKDPARNGGKDLPALLHHVEADALVLWGWNPGEGRTLPPLTHAKFVEAFRAWIDGGAECP